MFGRKVKDSIAVAKHMKITQERTLKVDRKRAIYTLLFQALFLVAVLVIQCLSFSFYNTIASSVVISLVVIIILSSICGFNAIFYVDQTRLGPFKIANLILFIVLGGALVAEQIVFKVDDAIENNKKAFQVNRILMIVFFALAFILDILLVVLMRTLKKKWQRTSEKNQLKSAVFNQESYESVLQSSLMMGGNNR